MKTQTKIQPLGKENIKQYITTVPKNIMEKFNLTAKQFILWEDATELVGIPAIILLPCPGKNHTAYYKKLKAEGLIE
jgi:hypothetical protein